MFAQRGDNQMAIAKKRGDMLLPTLRIHREQASSHLRGRVYASMIQLSEKTYRGIHHCSRARYCWMRPVRIG